MNTSTVDSARHRRWLCVSCLLWLGTVALAGANPTVDQQPVGPDGELYGCSLSPKGGHLAVLATKGSHYQIIMDGAAGPPIDTLIFNVSGNPHRPSQFGNAPIPVIFSKDGAHWAYMAKQGDEFLVMLDGKELARGPINSSTMAGALPLTFSANGQHVFWSNQDAQHNYVIFTDGKAGPAMRNLPQLNLSPDGNHYAYVNGNAWGFVDGRQVNYFGEDLQYTPRNLLISTMRAPDGNNVFAINGKPEMKAASFNQKWISTDGKQIAMVISPQNQAPTVLTVNGKPVAGTEGAPIISVYFSPDGNHYAAMASSRTGDKYMIVDGKKGAAYQNIQQDLPSQNRPHWEYVTWEGNGGDITEFEPKVPGFTADSSKFVYVATASSRQFLVIDDQESSGYNSLYPVLSPVGHRISAYGVKPDNSQHILMDDKDTSYGSSPAASDRISQLTFSPQANHYSFLRGNILYLDNVAQPGPLQGNFVFSSDDKYFAYEANFNGHQCLVVNGKNVCNKAGMVQHIFFSPDNNHIYFVNSGNLPVTEGIQTKDSNMLYVDGKPGVHYQDNAVALNPGHDGWATLHPEFAADGTMTFIARTDGNIRRISVKSDTTLDALLASAPPAK